MSNKRLLVLGGCLLVLTLASNAGAHDVLRLTCPNGCTIDKAFGTCDLTIDPYYGNIGWVLQTDKSTLPEGVTLVAMPPFGFATDASKDHYAKMIVVAGRAASGSYPICFDVTQIIPPYEPDEVRMCPCTLTIQ